MAERDVIEVLMEYKKWRTAEEITKEVGLSRSSVNYSLKMLISANIIKKKKHKDMKNGYLYKMVIYNG